MLENVKFKDAYNEQCKSILSFKFVLATIMKNCLFEYKHCNIDTIMNELIEKDIGSNGEKIIGYTNDFDDVRMDLFFSAALPNSNDSIGMLINLEPQKTTHVGYKINNRALLYSGYELVFQHGRNVTKKNYDQLKKVVSLWICFDAPSKEEENSITYFHLTKDVVLGYNIIEPKDYDKLQIIIIYMGQNSCNHPLLNFIELLFTNRIRPNEKIELLQKQFNLNTSSSFNKEVNEMCGLADRIEEQALKKGRAQGVTQGMAQGMAQGEFNQAYKNILTIMDSLNLSFEDALNALKLSNELQISCRKKYQEEFNN